MRRHAARGCALSLVALVLALVLGGRAAHAQLSTADKQALAQMALAWALDGGIPDTSLMKDPKDVVVEKTNLPPRVELKVPRRTVRVVSLVHAQGEADVFGDFLYFHFGPITGDGQRASVPITLTWAVGVRSKEKYLSGGGTTLQFERSKGKWKLLPVTERWTS